MTTRRDGLKRIGGRCFDVALGVFLIAVLVLIWNSSRTNANSANEAEATGSGVYAIIPAQGTICIVDDSNGNQIVFFPTGDYTFTDCAGFTLSGIGVYTKKGAVITLRDFEPDRRLDLSFDSAVRRAKLGLQVFSPPRLFTITDRNTAGDVCGCDGMAQ
ncbi:MAG: hypothetical protein AABO57_12715 [Acidobacteriota bacterium]